jgi:putative ATP-dependent endonuclease of OLD family
VAVLFHRDRIRKRCAIITDLDAAFIDTTANSQDTRAVASAKAAAARAQASGIQRKAALSTFCKDNPWLRPFFAPHTFEVDFVTAGNSSRLIAVLGKVYKDVAIIAAAKAELESNDIAVYGRRALTMANYEGKGWFAILVGKMIDHHALIPDYILDTVFFAHGEVANTIFHNILSYRLFRVIEDGKFGASVVSDFKTQLEAYKRGALDFVGIRAAMLAAFPADEINAILATF